MLDSVEGRRKIKSGEDSTKMRFGLKPLVNIQNKTHKWILCRVTSAEARVKCRQNAVMFKLICESVNHKAFKKLAKSRGKSNGMITLSFLGIFARFEDWNDDRSRESTRHCASKPNQVCKGEKFLGKGQ